MGDVDNIMIGGATVAIGGDLGFIRDGVTISPNAEHYFVEQIEGFPGRHKARRTSETYEIAFTLEEPTLQNTRIGWDITNATSGADPILLNFGSDSVKPQERLIAIGGLAPGASEFTRGIFLPRCIASSPGEFKITDFEESKLPCVFTAEYQTSTSLVGQFSDQQS